MEEPEAGRGMIPDQEVGKLEVIFRDTFEGFEGASVSRSADGEAYA